jgi:twitching motility protein PilJ
VRSRQLGFLQRRDKREKTMTAATFKPPAQKSGLLYAMVMFLVLLLAFVAVTFFLITRESRNEQVWIRLSTDLQVHSQQLAKSAAEAVEGNRGAFLQLGDSAGATRRHGYPEGRRPGAQLAALPGALAYADRSRQSLEPYEHNATYLRAKCRCSNWRRQQRLHRGRPANPELTDRAIRDLTQSGAPTQQVFVAGRQLVLSDRVLRHLKEMLRGGAGSVAAAYSFTREIEFFEQTMNALLSGSRSVGVQQVTTPGARDALNRARLVYDDAKPQLETILASTSDILAVRGAADEIFADSLKMFLLSRSVGRSSGPLRVAPVAVLWSGSLACWSSWPRSP